MKQFLICLALISFLSETSFAQTKIGKAEESLKREDSRPFSSNQSDTNNSDHNENPFALAIAELFLQGFLHISYYTFIESPYEVRESYFTKHPYISQDQGNYTYDFNENTSRFKGELMGRYVFENNTLNGAQIMLDMHFLERLGLEIDFLQLWENNPNFGTDNLAIINILAKYYRVRSQKFDLWWGLGTTYVAGSVNQFGFTYGLGTEWFFVKPLSLEANFNQSFINTETVNTFKGLLNYHKQQFKCSAGYEHFKIGTPSFSTITVGLGIFF